MSLRCVNDGDDATGVCGVCGSPLCTACQSERRDSRLATYTSGAGLRLALAVAVLVGPFLLLNVVFPNAVLIGSRALFGRSLFLKAGLVNSGYVLGLALLFSVWYRPHDSLLNVRVLDREGTARILCEDCVGDVQSQRVLHLGVQLVAGLLALGGVYLVFTSGLADDLWVVALGGAVYVVRDEIVLGIGALTGETDA
ncbi:hypothetical protein N0B31_13715 [Salinirubellus salinus]|uniref:Uncharacterized protein n=1 Tax=Salinirubellus salinus TaxID=1364945 RepID=A0A9E7R022_9EURY|nr:hypothetical protein [Salinirubellus salinus]UWM53195.1 hypothetical protein N0B31_13715 [Salinirubellus salinus]